MDIKEELLMHWFHYYGKSIYTFAELETFQESIEKYGAEKVLQIAVMSWANGDGSPQIILMSIRKNILPELFETLPDISEMDEEAKEQYEILRDAFIAAISETF